MNFILLALGFKKLFLFKQDDYFTFFATKKY